MQTAAPKHQWLVLAGFILLCIAVGSIGGFATQNSIDTWYNTLATPSWNPPTWGCAPVWTLLYIMMGTAAWLVWKTKDRIGPAMVLFFAQLGFNLLWSLVFFGLRSPGLALVEVVFLVGSVALTMLACFGRQSTAGWLFAPYLAWVSFAAVLNAAIWWLN